MTHYRIVRRQEPSSWYYPQRKAWWTLGLWWPMTVTGECELANARRVIDLATGKRKLPAPQVIHEESAP